MSWDTDEKGSVLIKKILALKHPEVRDMDVSSLPEFESCSTLMDTVVTGKLVQRVVKSFQDHQDHQALIQY